MALAAERLASTRGRPMTALAPSLQAYFTERLIGQRAASPNTIAAYRLTFRLLLAFAASARGKAPAQPGHRRPRRAADRRVPGPPRAGPAQQRRTRNNRLAASTRCSATSPCTTPSTPPPSSGCWPSRPSAPSATWSPTSPKPRPTRCSAPATRTTWTGRRDHAMLALAIQTGLRISELAGLTRQDITLTAGRQRAHRRQGKEGTADAAGLRAPCRPEGLAREQPGIPGDPLFPTTTGRQPQPRRDRTPPRPPRGRRRDDAAPRSRPSASPCTRCATPPPCACCWPATTSPSSPSGSATSRSPRRTSTCTPT